MMFVHNFLIRVGAMKLHNIYCAINMVRAEVPHVQRHAPLPPEAGLKHHTTHSNNITDASRYEWVKLFRYISAPYVAMLVC
jgi:hypothetical protein